MQAVNKIHVSSATKISLNDRFTIIQTVRPKSPGPHKQQATLRPVRNRPRSRSRSQGREKASLQNRVLLQQLDQKHKMRAALRIKRKSLRSTLPARQRLGTNQTRQRAAIIKRGLDTSTQRVVGGRLKRSRSNANIGTMQADLVRPRRRSNSTAGLASRLGTCGVVAGTTQSPRRRLNRSNLPPPMRSNSRVAVARANSQSRRSSSRGRLPAARDLSAQRQGPRQSRSVSRNRPNTPNLQTRRGAAAAAGANTRSRSRSRGRTAAATRGARSVNARLGPNRTRAAGLGRQAATGSVRVIRGRVLKRRASNAGGVAVGQQGRRNASVGTAKQRLGRTRTRVAQATNGRSRSVSRGRGQQQGKNNNKNVPRLNRSAGGAGRQTQTAGNSPRGGGRSRSRRRGNGRPTTAGPVKKEDLDKELDQYMVNTKAINDLDHLMI